MNKNNIRLIIVGLLALSLFNITASSLPSNGTVTRSFSTTTPIADTVMTVTLMPSGFASEGFYQVSEIIPSGFTFISTDADNVKLSENNVTFTKLSGSPLTYNVTTPQIAANINLFNGTFSDNDRNVGDVIMMMLGNTVQTYDGTPKKVTVTTNNGGVVWRQINNNATYTPRQGHIFLVLNNKMFICEGVDAWATWNRDCWSSIDGNNWTQTTSNIGMTYGRESGKGLVYNGRMYLFGGWYDPSPGHGSYNDVWSSTDGVDWTQITSNANWTPRNGFGVTVFDNKMWIVAGIGGTQSNDVWSSTDGANWIQANASTAFSPRDNPILLNYSGAMWLIGGDTGGTRKNDVWNSTDGITWNLVTSSANFSTRFVHQGIVFDNKMWVIGGLTGTNTDLNDVWYSTNGVEWTATNLGAEWTARHGHAVEVFNNQMWITGGYNTPVGIFNDVWESTGINISVTYNGSTIQPVNVGNYDVIATINDVGVISGILTILPRSVTVVANSYNKYEDDPDPLLSYMVASDFVGGGVFMGSLSRVVGEDIGSYTITQGTLSLSTNNYNLRFVNGTMNILQRIITPISISVYITPTPTPTPVQTSQYVPEVQYVAIEAAPTSPPVTTQTPVATVSDSQLPTPTPVQDTVIGVVPTLTPPTIPPTIITESIVVPSPIPTQSPSPTLSSRILIFDRNRDNRIQKDEAVRAVIAYFNNIIDRETAIGVVVSYFNE